MELSEEEKALVVQAYSLPAWLKVKLEDEARMNERAASAELRVRLAASFGLRTDGTPLAGGDAHGPDDGAAPRLDDEATGGPSNEA